MEASENITTILLDAGWVQALRGWAYRHAPQLAASLGLLVVGALSVLLLSWPRSAGISERSAPAIPRVAARAMVLVYVSGAVTEPGIYRLEAGLRVRDAIEIAGGLLPEADMQRLPNLAARLRDGREIHVIYARAPAARTPKRIRADQVDINSADVSQLERVPGIDPALAQAIVAQREAFGPYARLSELKSALGIDARLFRQIRGYLRVE